MSQLQFFGIDRIFCHLIMYFNLQNASLVFIVFCGGLLHWLFTFKMESKKELLGSTRSTVLTTEYIFREPYFYSKEECGKSFVIILSDIL